MNYPEDVMDSAEDEIWNYKSKRKLKSGNGKVIEKCTLVPNRKEKNPDISSKKYDNVRVAQKLSKGASSQISISTSCDNEGQVDPQFADRWTSPSEPGGHSANVQEEQTFRSSKTVYEGFCPSCQVPFSVLSVQTPEWHVAECLENPVHENVNECPDGLKCTSTVPDHFRRYTHFQLAHSRAAGDKTSFVFESLQESLASTSSCSSQSINDSPLKKEAILKRNDITTSIKSNALLLLRSPSKLDIKKKAKKNSSPRAFKKRTTKLVDNCDLIGSQGSGVSQLSQNHSQPNESSGPDCHNLLIKPGNSSLQTEDDISYSPLCSDAEEQLSEQSSKGLPFVKSNTATIKKNFLDIQDINSASDQHCQISNSQSDSSAPDLWNEDLSDDLFLDYITQSPLEGIDSSKAINADCAGGFTQSGQTNPASQYNEHIKEEAWPPTFILPASAFLTSSPVCSELKTRIAGNLSCVKKQAVGQIPSPQSLILEQLRDHLGQPSERNSSSSASVVKQTLLLEKSMAENAVSAKSSSNISKKPSLSARGLKQTDIGVFFGLKPLKEKATKMPEENPVLISKSSCLGSKLKPRKRKSSTQEEKLLTTKEYRSTGSQSVQKNEGQLDKRKRFKRGVQETAGSEVAALGKRCPFYKKIPGTTFVVDAFRYGVIEGCTGYFLTHFHSDHYDGLKKSFQCPIYCNKITGNLVKSKLRVHEQYVNILPMNVECSVDGVKVVLLDANHCPGAAMLFFHLPNGTTVLHTGDFRADPSMEKDPVLMNTKVQTLYLDTTYCSPEYTFPTQQEAINFAATVAFETLTLNPKTLVVCGTYSVGKEKIFLAVADVLGCKVCMSRDKYNTMRCLELDRIQEKITMDWNSTQLHLLPMMRINFRDLYTHLNKFLGKYDKILAFKPTGWTYSGVSNSVADIRPDVKGNITIYGIPYSEHSSYLEMKRFVQWLGPKRIIPTVNVGNWKERKAMENIFSEWTLEAESRLKK
ncbi:DNA cross-link repair 1A protein [Erpetoichthys calabaricus]|uniref:DNA cross-link repair 1A protein n=1 Tax=Erpetoichthys calabaricus TaxID=27687 RepID=UPI0022347094|nr:DNA cross-link repair 1A protein [Erpetoichthys calabaricus]